MIGLLVLAILVGYILLSKFIVNKVYEKTKSIQKKNIAIAIMILIPTWDVILGLPVYGYLCLFESGTKIYKTVDDVEGFYIGKRDSKFEPHEPYEGYKYIDYKEMNHYKPTGKYYRSYWIDSNTSNLCVQPNSKYPFGKYAKIFKTGKCIAKEEIPESKVSRWEYHYGNIEKAEIFLLGIKQIELAFVKDRDEQKQIAETKYIWWKAGFITGYFLTGWGVTFTPSGFECGYTRELNFLNKTLKTKKEER